MQVIYSQEQEIDKIPVELKEQFYPQNVDSTAPMANKDYHTRPDYPAAIEHTKSIYNK